MSKFVLMFLIVFQAGCKSSSSDMAVPETIDREPADDLVSNRVRLHGPTCRELSTAPLRHASPLAAELLYTVDSFADPWGIYRYYDLLTTEGYQTWPNASHDIPVDVSVRMEIALPSLSWHVTVTEYFGAREPFQPILSTGLPGIEPIVAAEWAEVVLATIVDSDAFIEFTWSVGKGHARSAFFGQPVDHDKVRKCINKEFLTHRFDGASASWSHRFESSR